MKRYLFEGFLDEKLIYQVCRIYWEIRFEDFFNKHKITGFSVYLSTTFGDGTDFMNGNPIVHYAIKSQQRAVRIIQENPNPNDLEITAWLDEFETEDTNLRELVISLQHTPDAEKTAFELIEKWLVYEYSKEKMEKFIDLKIELEKLEVDDLSEISKSV